MPLILTWADLSAVALQRWVTRQALRVWKTASSDANKSATCAEPTSTRMRQPARTPAPRTTIGACVATTMNGGTTLRRIDGCTTETKIGRITRQIPTWHRGTALGIEDWGAVASMVRLPPRPIERPPGP